MLGFFTLTQRAKRVLALLCQVGGPVSCAHIAAVLGTSARSVRYDLDLIDCWQVGRPFRLTRTRGIGVRVEGDIQSLLRELEGAGGSECYLTQEDRILGCADFLLWRPGFATASHIAEEFGVSVNTIYSCLLEVQRWLAARGLSLVRSPGKGLRVAGDEVAIRQAMAESFWATTNVHKYPRRELLDTRAVPLESIYRVLTSIARAHGWAFSSHVILSLVTHFVVSSLRCQSGNVVSFDPDVVTRIERDKVWRAAQQAVLQCRKLRGVVLDEQDLVYLAIRWRGALLTEGVRSTAAALWDSDLQAIDGAYMLLAEIGKSCDVDLTQDIQVVTELSAYLMMALYRLRYGLRMANRHIDEIRRRYPRLYRAATDACSRFGRICRVGIGDDQIGWIAVHAVAALERARANTVTRPRVAVAFTDRICMARLLEARLRTEFPEIDVLPVVASEDLDSVIQRLNPDLALATDDIDESSAPVIVVNPFLPASEVRAVARLIHPSGIVEQGDNEEHPARSRRKPGDFLRNARFALLRDVQGLKPDEILRQGLFLLESKGLVSQQYRDAVLGGLASQDYCCVVSPGLAIPHGKPTDGAIADFVLAIVPDRPISFGNSSFDPVRLIIVWCARNTDGYREFMCNVVDILGDTALLERLVSAVTPDQVRSQLARASFGGEPS